MSATSFICGSPAAGSAALSLSIDMADPLSRMTHRVIELPAYVAEIKPVISSFNVVRHNTFTDRAVWIGMVCNAPATLKPDHDWTLSLRYRPTTGLLQDLDDAQYRGFCAAGRPGHWPKF